MKTLPAGTAVGHYRVLSIVGVGGMGEVYQALDTNLERVVALKVLSQQFLQSQETVDRFVQEARAASALNHPNIVTVHEVGTADVTIEGDGEGTLRRVHYIAMEFIEGQTLRTLMDRGALTLKRKISLLAQVADGLAKAHRAGIVHRDLKPDNIMVTGDGFAKLLDFGLAKLLERDRPFTASAARHLTRDGAVIGTIGYMSPEQVEGQPVDHRADIFSFGCILYQAVTGRGPFESDSVVDTLHRIVHSDPEPVRRFTSVPPLLAAIIERSLRKKPDERVQSMQEVASALHAAAEEIEPVAVVRRRHHLAWRAALVASVLAALAGAAWLVWLATRPAPFEMMNITEVAGTGRTVAASISPDGRYVVYAVDDHGRQSLAVRLLATESHSVIVPLADVHYVACAFSPDGNYVYYVSADNRSDRGTLYRIPTLGGTPQLLFDDVHATIALSPDGRRIAWASSDRATGRSTIHLLGVDERRARIVATRRLPDSFISVAWTPDGSRITYSIGSFAGGFHTTLGEADLARRRELPIKSPRWRSIDSIAWLPDGRTLVVVGRDQPTAARNQVWLLTRDGRLRRVTNDLNDYTTIAVTGSGERLTTVQKTTVATLWLAPGGDSSRARELSSSAGSADGIYGLTCTPSGVVYSADSGESRDLWLADLGPRPPQRLTDGRSDVHPDATPDGKVVIFASMRSGRTNLWKLDLATRRVTQLTSGNFETNPAVTADGKWVVYHTNRSGVRTIWRVPIGGGEPVQITTTPSSWAAPSPDGRHIACSWFDRSVARAKIALIPSDGGEPERLLDIPVNSWMGGNNHLVRWRGETLTYVATEEGVSNIFARRADGTAPPERVTRFSEGQIFYFDWTADRKDLVLSRGRITSHVVTIDSFR
ncbi:MAG TPA: protein kinase [Thermoanaerobaculia bacterium]|nr:protein kinase [Thermoanaerobaculia bacterium]